MAAKIRKITRYVQDIAIECGRETVTPVRMITTAVAIKNARAGLGFVENWISKR